MRIPLILAAGLAATAAIAQAPRIKWKPMDFPPTTTVEVSFDGEQRSLGDIKPFYEFVKLQKWSCAFDNVDLSSGLQTLSCQAPNKRPWLFYVEYLPEKKRLRFDTGEFAGNERNADQVGAYLAFVYSQAR